MKVQVKQNAGTYIGVIGATMFWGLSFVWSGQLLRNGFPLYSLLGIRLFLASMLLLAVAVISKKFVRIKRRDLKWFLLLVIFEPFLYFIGETNGIVLTDSPAISSIVISTLPLFTMVMGYAIYNERISKTNMAGVFIALAGVILSLMNEEMQLNVHPLGFVMLLLAVFSATGYSLVIKKLSDNYTPVMIVLWQNLIGVVFFLPFCLFEANALSHFNFSFRNIYPLLLLVIFPSCIAFLSYVQAIHHIGVTKASMFCTLIPVVTLLFSAFMGLEKLYTYNVAGVLIVVAGLVLSQLKKR